MLWPVDCGDRRTFITTPYKFRIEPQTHKDTVESLTENINLRELKLETKTQGLENDLLTLFGEPVTSIHSVAGDAVTIKEALIEGLSLDGLFDPNGVKFYNI